MRSRRALIAIRDWAGSHTEAVWTVGLVAVVLLSVALWLTLTSDESATDERLAAPETPARDTPSTSVSLDACAAAHEAERRASVDLAALNGEMDEQIALAHQDSEAAAAEFRNNVAAAVADARDRARAAADPSDPDGEYAGSLVSLAMSVSAEAASGLTEARIIASERIDRELDEHEAELAIRHVSAFSDVADYEAHQRAIEDFESYTRWRQRLRQSGFDPDRFDAQHDRFLEEWTQSVIAYTTVGAFVGDVLWQVAAITERELSQHILEGQPHEASAIADFAETSAREIWAAMRARSTVPEHYRDAEAQAIFDAARVVGRAVHDSPGPLVEVAAEHVQRVVAIENSPIAEAIDDASGDLQRARAEVADACEG